jgi:hypothetical protein
LFVVAVACAPPPAQPSGSSTPSNTTNFGQTETLMCVIGFVLVLGLFSIARSKASSSKANKTTPVKSQKIVQCPNCGSFATLPMERWQNMNPSGRFFLDILFVAMGFDYTKHPENENVDKYASWETDPKFKEFQEGRRKAFCRTCRFEFFNEKTTVTSKNTSPSMSTGERLKELEKLHTAKLISEEEYKNKRQDILRGL